MTPLYMLDTNICIYISKHKPLAVKARFESFKPGQVVMSVVTYGELHYGASKSEYRNRALEKLQVLIELIPVEHLDLAVAQAYGELRAFLERRGQAIGNNDLWIGAHALSRNLTLATNNEREFSRVPGLTVENWAT